MEFSYIDIKRVSELVGLIISKNSKTSKLQLAINNNNMRFIIETKNIKLSKEVKGKCTNEYYIELNAEGFIKAIKQFYADKHCYTSVLNFNISNDKLIISGTKHTDELDVETMDYKTKEEVITDVEIRQLKIEDITDIECKIHGSDEWDLTEFNKVINIGILDGGNIYIAGTAHKAFTIENNSLIEVDINEYIGQNTIISKGIADKIKKIICHQDYKKLYVNNRCNKLNIQSWDNTFKLELKTSKEKIDDVQLYKSYTGIDYDKININLIKHRIIEIIKRLMLTNDGEVVELRLYNNEYTKEYSLSLNDTTIDSYSIIVSNELRNQHLKIKVNIKNLYMMLDNCESDFIAVDITMITDEFMGGVIVRIAELDLEKYENAYEEQFSNISHFELREFLNTEEHLLMRTKCLCKKSYTTFLGIE